jgi:hypothetical protein
MEAFDAIEELRQKNNFVERSYAKYKNELRLEIKRGGVMRTIYKLELNLAKFLVLKSRNLLRNSLRILRKDGSRFGSLYGAYTANILQHSTDGTVDLDALLRLREELIDYGSFVEHIDLLIETSSSDFDPSRLKIGCQWNDIGLCFDTKRERDAFLEGKAFDKGSRYDLVLANLIMAADRRRRQLFSLVNKGPGRTGCILKKIGRMHEAFSKLDGFLKENLSHSAHVEQMLMDAEWMHSYYTKISEYISCVSVDEEAEPTAVPETLEEIKDKIAEGRAEAQIDAKSAKAAMLKYLEDSFRPKPSQIAVPFIPVFYDIAFDYVSYPAESRKATELFNSMHK